MEVKAQKMTKVSISRSYRAFLAKYKPATALLLNYNLRQKQKIGKTNLISLTIADIRKSIAGSYI